jgi:hypothetical protein
MLFNTLKVKTYAFANKNLIIYGFASLNIIDNNGNLLVK